MKTPKTHPPHTNLSPAHRSEIVDGSGVSAKIAELNFKTITDPREADQLLNRNTQKRQQHSDHLVPGWAVTGIDPKTGESWHQGAQFKPDTPTPGADGKTQKYLSASGYDTQPLFLDTGNPQYWPGVLGTPTTPIVITEGAKKSGCLLSLGYAAVSLPGVWNGQIKGRLKTAIQQLCAVGRRVYLAFDSDQVVNPKVAQALDRLGRLLTAAGCVVSVVTWDAQYKGVDDLVVSAGKDAVKAAIEDAATLEEWRAASRLKGENPQPHFAVDDRATWWVSFEQGNDGQIRETLTRIGNPLTAIAYVNSPDNDQAGILLEFKTQSGQTRRWTMPRRELGGDKSAILGELLAQEYGVVFDQTKRLAKYLTELGAGIPTRYTVTDKTGWVESSFVLPDRTIGDQSLKFGNPEDTTPGKLKTVGTVESWRESVGAKCQGNSRLIFGVGAALAGPLTPVFEIESGGFHLVGQTSQGKTTVLTVAGSVMGMTTADLPSWNTTTNGLEGVAAEFNNLLLPLDEIGQADPRAVGNCAYLLGNGTGKTRMSKNLTTRKPKTWRLLTLSSGELGLGEYLKQAGVNQKGGQEARMPDIPAVPQGSQFGVFEAIHCYSSAADFVTQLEADCRDNRGAVLTAYLERLGTDRSTTAWLTPWRQRLWEIVGLLTANINDAAIGRVAKRFALVQVALEIAHGYGLLPFPIEQAAWAVQTLFTDWVDSRGGAGSVEVKQCLERIEAEFVKHQHGDRIYNVDSPPPDPIRNLLAYRKTDAFTGGHEYWIPAAVFRELTAGVDRELVVAELQKRGWLLGPGADGKAPLVRRLGRATLRVYVVTQFWHPDQFGETIKNGVTGVTGVTTSDNPCSDRGSGVTPPVTPENGRGNRCNNLPSDKSSEAQIFFSDDDAVTPVTPADPGCNRWCNSQTLDSGGVSESVTPVTPVTPKKHDIPENEGNKSNGVDDWEGDY